VDDVADDDDIDDGEGVCVVECFVFIFFLEMKVLDSEEFFPAFIRLDWTRECCGASFLTNFEFKYA